VTQLIRKRIISNTSKKNELKLVAKLNPSITQGNRKKEDVFEFNKDAGMYVCKAGHIAIRLEKLTKVQYIVINFLRALLLYGFQYINDFNHIKKTLFNK
jgi:hypothetical protein